MDPNRLSHKIFKVANKGKATGFLWSKQVEKDLTELNINQATIIDRNNFRLMVRTKPFVTSLTAVSHKQAGNWSEERKKEFSRKMKEYWANRKAQNAAKNTTKRQTTTTSQLKHKHRGP